MDTKRITRSWILTGIALLTLAVVALLTWAPGARAQTDRQTDRQVTPFTSPLPTPAPTPQSLSREAQIALNYLAAQHNLLPAELQIVNEHTRTYPLIGRSFKAFTIWTRDAKDFRAFNLLVELESGVVEADVNAIVAQEQAAYRARYGKLMPALYERLQQAKEDELLPIAVWMAPDPAARSQEAIFAELVRQPPRKQQGPDPS